MVDRREDNGQRKVTEEYAKVTEEYAAELLRELEKSPPEFGHGRPTWRLRLSIRTMADRTGVKISFTTMSRLLKAFGVRRGRPKPLAPCPWSKGARNARMRMIRRLVATLPPQEVAVWEDEADIDLNLRIGSDWTLPGRQRVVLTPGKNVKRYVAGALDAQTERLVWVKGKKKDSGLFIALLRRLQQVYGDKRVIHVILDNYTIHSSRRTRTWLAEHGKQFRLHFGRTRQAVPATLPAAVQPGRKQVWREMRANVTYNHTCRTIDELQLAVGRWMGAFNRRTGRRVAESRKAI